MEQFTIYCTPEQTHRALELGAPISGRFIVDGVKYKLDKFYFANDIAYTIPTVEQMVGWLEEQDSISDLHIYKMIQSWTYQLFLSNGGMEMSKDNYGSRKEATLAAIDSALEYLQNN